MKTRLPLDPTGKPRVFEVGTEAFVLYIFSFHFLIFSLSFFFFPSFFLFDTFGPHLQPMEVLRLGDESELPLWTILQPQQC